MQLTKEAFEFYRRHTGMGQVGVIKHALQSMGVQLHIPTVLKQVEESKL